MEQTSITIIPLAGQQKDLTSLHSLRSWLTFLLTNFVPSINFINYFISEVSSKIIFMLYIRGTIISISRRLILNLSLTEQKFEMYFLFNSALHFPSSFQYRGHRDSLTQFLKFWPCFYSLRLNSITFSFLSKQVGHLAWSRDLLLKPFCFSISGMRENFAC